MKTTALFLALLVSGAIAATVEVGTAEYPANMPFCAD